jgi:hypothetical protein
VAWETARRAGLSSKEFRVSYLTCPSCRFTVSSSAASSPFQNCPRCLLRESAAVMMVVMHEPPRRFGRGPSDVTRIAEAKARLSGPARGVGSA